MKLRFFGIENPIEFRQGIVSVLEIENKTLFRNVIFSLNKIYNGFQSNLSVTIENNHTIEPMNKFELMSDVLNLDLSASQSKINKFILQEMEKNLDEYRQIFDDFLQIKSNILKLLNEIPFDLSYTEPEVFELIKDFNFKIDCTNRDNYLTAFLNYLKAIKMLNVTDFVICIDLKKYFCDVEILQIYEQAFILDLQILLIESVRAPQMLQNEWKLSIDDDLFECIPLEL